MTALATRSGWHLGRRRVPTMRARIIERLKTAGVSNREIARRLGLTDDGHQTPVITSRRDLADSEVAYRMFERWRQENFFKYRREEFLLDALTDYQVEPDNPTRTVPNPERRALDKEIPGARGEVAKLEQAYGAAAVVDNPEGSRPTMRGFKLAHGKIGKELRTARSPCRRCATRSPRPQPRSLDPASACASPSIRVHR